MIFRRRTYKIHPDKLEVFNDFFHTYLYPNQLKHGSELIGRWVNEAKDEITAIWKYDSMEQYEEIEKSIRKSELHRKAQVRRKELGQLYIESRQDFITSTAPQDPGYHPPKQIVAVSAYITNEQGEVLLIRNLHRSDTMELPGGQVENGESLEEAALREVFEETGVKVNLHGVTGIYQNMTVGVVGVVFRGEYQSGELTPKEGETTEVLFAPLSKENASQYITREHMLDRALDAIDPTFIPYEYYNVRPFELINRLKGSKV